MPKKSLDRVNSVDSIIEQDSPALSDISERDAPWDEHRATSDKVSDYYQGTEFQGYSVDTPRSKDAGILHSRTRR